MVGTNGVWRHVLTQYALWQRCLTIQILLFTSLQLTALPMCCPGGSPEAGQERQAHWEHWHGSDCNVNWRGSWKVQSPPKRGASGYLRLLSFPKAVPQTGWQDRNMITGMPV